MRIVGMIYKAQIKDRMIGIKSYQRILYFHFQNSQLSLFKRYLYTGIYIDLDYDEEKTFVRKGISAYFVNFVHQIYRVGVYQRIQYYNHNQINSSLSSFLSSLGNVMFLDLEMTMPSYAFSGKGYRTEIIQVGYVLLNGEGNELCRYSQYIKPVIHTSISKRTLDFLKISAQDFYQNAIDYSSFYEDFEMIIQQFHPTIVIFGKNDRIILNDSFKLHKVKSLSDSIRYVNLSKLIQTYYHLKNEPGLFRLYQTYYENQEMQIHDALNDSYVTMAVFKAFRDDVNHKTNYFMKIKDKF